MKDNDIIEISEELREAICDAMRTFEEKKLNAAEITLAIGLMFKINSYMVGRNTLESSIDLYEMIYNETGFKMQKRGN